MNPLWWLHLRISGNVKSNLYLLLAYFGIVGLATSLSYNFLLDENPSGRSIGGFYTVWAGIISGAQAIFLLLLIPSAIKRAVQRDYQLGMVESLRLTPMTDSRVVLGYLVGPAIPPLLLFAPGLLMGAYFSVKAASHGGVLSALGTGGVLGMWFGLMGLLVIAATMIASIALLSAIAVREHKFNILGIIIAGAILGGSVLVFLIPGISLLTGVMSGSVLFSSLGRAVALGDRSSLATAALMQSLFALTFLAAAARRYRRPDRPVFTLELSHIVLALTGLTLLIGMVHTIGLPRRNPIDDQMAASLVAFMAASMWVLNAAAHDRLRFDRAAQFDLSYLKKARLRSMTPLITTGIAMLLVAVMVFVMPPEEYNDKLRLVLQEPFLWAAIAIAVLLAAWFDYSLLYIGAALRWKTWILLLIGWGILKIAPPLIGLWISDIYAELYSDNPEITSWPLERYVRGISPLGTIWLTIDRPCFEIGFGLAAQAGLAGVAAWIARMVQPKAWSRSEPDPAPGEFQGV